MVIERSFSIIKPDITRRNLIGSVTKMLEESQLRIVASRRVLMTLREAEGFYAEHSQRPFFKELCTFMSSGATIVQVLEGENAVIRNRTIMGATNPEDAEEGTIRKTYGLSLTENSVHGSDSLETAKREIAYWFSEVDIKP